MDERHALGLVFASKEALRLYAKFGFFWISELPDPSGWGSIHCMVRFPSDCGGPGASFDERLVTYMLKIARMRPPSVLDKVNSAITRLEKEKDVAEAEKAMPMTEKDKMKKSNKIAGLINSVGEGRAVVQKDGTIMITGDLNRIAEKLADKKGAEGNSKLEGTGSGQEIGLTSG
jgi:hypothetical protein